MRLFMIKSLWFGAHASKLTFFIRKKSHSPQVLAKVNTTSVIFNHSEKDTIPADSQSSNICLRLSCANEKQLQNQFWGIFPIRFKLDKQYVRLGLISLAQVTIFEKLILAIWGDGEEVADCLYWEITEFSCGVAFKFKMRRG